MWPCESHLGQHLGLWVQKLEVTGWWAGTVRMLSGSGIHCSRLAAGLCRACQQQDTRLQAVPLQEDHQVRSSGEEHYAGEVQRWIAVSLKSLRSIDMQSANREQLHLMENK